jgi:hypothetical protein
MTRRHIAIVAALIAFTPITVRGQNFISDYTPAHGSLTGTTGITTTLSNRISGAEDETQPILIRATTQITGGAVVNEAKCDVLLIEFMP